MFDKSRGYVPAQKLSAYYGERPKRQKLPNEPKTAIDFCLNCQKRKKKCNGDCAMLAKNTKTISKGEQK